MPGTLDVAENATKLRIVSYNILEGGRERLASIAHVLRAQEPDAVLLCEADFDAAASLAGELDLEVAFGEGNQPGCHVAWLSRLPVRRVENHRLPVLAKTLVELEVEWNGSPLGLFGAHLASRHEEGRYPRATEIEAILGVLTRAPARRLLVGDLNALHPDDRPGEPPPGVVPRGEAVPGARRPIIPRILAAGYVDGFRSTHPRKPGYTYPADAPWLRLDYVFASRAMAARLVDCDVVTTADARRASDHLPLRADFDLADA